MDGQDDREVGSGGGSLTLLKFALVVVGVAALVLIMMPRFWLETEEPRISDALTYLGAVRAAQERYRADAGSYADDLAKLRIAGDLPVDFSASAMAAGDSGDFASSWRMTLTRIAPTSFGSYTIVFGDGGFDAQRSTIDEKVSMEAFLEHAAAPAASSGTLHLATSASIHLASAAEDEGAGGEEAPSDGTHPGMRAGADASSFGPCGSAATPRCDGHCAQGNACVIKNDRCICVPTPTPCGALASFPLCYGVCPPGQVCRDVGSGCECGG